MNFETKWDYKRMLMSLFVNVNVQATKVLNEANFEQRTTSLTGTFQEFCANIVTLNEAGLTRLRDITKHSDGRYAELTFEQVFTPAGESLLKEPYSLDPDVKSNLKAMLARQIVTGVSDSPLISASGEILEGLTLSSLMTPDQIRENARNQLRIMGENEILDSTKQGVDSDQEDIERLKVQMHIFGVKVFRDAIASGLRWDEIICSLGTVSKSLTSQASTKGNWSPEDAQSRAKKVFEMGFNRLVVFYREDIKH
jgi:hypothetical protein